MGDGHRRGHSFSTAMHQLEIATTHQYLGVWLDSRLSFATQVRYLRERAAARTNILRALSARSAGASYRVMRAFYVHAIRSVIDYSAPCLCSLSLALLSKLEVAQNDALRVILGAPTWCRVENLQAESGLPSLQHRILARTACSAAKLIRTRPELPVSTQLIQAFQRPVNQIADGDWVHAAADAIRCLGADTLVRSGPDLPHPQYTHSPPWRPPPLDFALPNGTPRSTLLPTKLRQEALQRLASLQAPSTASYFTDGSVGEDGSAGAAFVLGQQATSMRLSQGASIMQAELAAILGALRHASLSPQSRVILNSDSLSALQVLKSGSLKDNKWLITSILLEAGVLASQGKTVLLHWVPSHVGLRGNEMADREANVARQIPDITLNIIPSWAKTKQLINAASLDLTHDRHHCLTLQGSRSATWYKTATNYQPLAISPSVTNTIVTRIRRLRLGYPTLSEIRNEEPENCPHCLDPQTEPLLHYTLFCPATMPLHPRGIPVPLDDEMARQLAAERIASTPVKITARLVATYPPP